MPNKLLTSKWGLIFIACLLLHAYVTVRSQLSTFSAPARQSADTIAAFTATEIQQAFAKGRDVSVLFGITPKDAPTGSDSQVVQEILFKDLSPVLVAVSESNGEHTAKLKLTLDGKEVWQNVAAGQQLYGYDVSYISLHRIELSRQQDTVVLPLFMTSKQDSSN